MSVDQGVVQADEIVLPLDEFVQLASFAASSDNPAAPVLLRRLARRYRTDNGRAAQELVSILRAGPVRSAAATSTPDPIDVDSRLPLLRREEPVAMRMNPIYDDTVFGAISQIVAEHLRRDTLYAAGLAPTRTALFVGPPGVGKTLAARWIAQQFDLPLLTLDLSSVMSSFLGRTGSNIRRVLDHARSSRCVLLLDELDAIAKRRDDASEIGELKRLVTVLLQEIDRWPEGSLLIAATNHGDLLDPAVWRRFEAMIEFPLPTSAARAEAIRQLLGDEPIEPAVADMVVSASKGSSLSELESEVLTARRRAAVGGMALSESLLATQKLRIERLPQAERIKLANRVLRQTQLSQRQVSQLTGVSRDTLRKHMVTGGADAH